MFGYLLRLLRWVWRLLQSLWFGRRALPPPNAPSSKSYSPSFCELEPQKHAKRTNFELDKRAANEKCAESYSASFCEKEPQKAAKRTNFELIERVANGKYAEESAVFLSNNETNQSEQKLKNEQFRNANSVGELIVGSDAKNADDVIVDFDSALLINDLKGGISNYTDDERRSGLKIDAKGKEISNGKHSDSNNGVDVDAKRKELSNENDEDSVSSKGMERSNGKHSDSDSNRVVFAQRDISSRKDRSSESKRNEFVVVDFGSQGSAFERIGASNQNEQSLSANSEGNEQLRNNFGESIGTDLVEVSSVKDGPNDNHRANDSETLTNIKQQPGLAFDSEVVSHDLFDFLPVEIVCHIVEFLDMQSIAAFRNCCARARSMVTVRVLRNPPPQFAVLFGAGVRKFEASSSSGKRYNDRIMAHLIGLESLELEDCTAVTDASLVEMTRLTHLALQGICGVTGSFSSPPADFSALTHLNLFRNYAFQGQYLARFPNLTYLNLQMNKLITDEDLLSLRHAPLRYLNLAENQMVSGSCLLFLTRIQHLDLWGNERVLDSHLENLALVELNLRANIKITGVGLSRSFETLQVLILRNNTAFTNRSLENFTNLKTLDVTRNNRIDRVWFGTNRPDWEIKF